ncbi:amidohydrolase family protein [Amycolatopsis anabasis]|uniref:amidohydrolase family protein n=1 Tax=Amycolatopsis anabasis TaxID=1840409 RepID=UPI00131ADB59|nr:amidohydrolase family protein [Amycolatopsis anabasis]
MFHHLAVLTLVLGLAPVPGHAKEITVDEGTNLAVTAAPESGTMVLDVQGQLFTLPRSGGQAKPIRQGFLDPFWPDLAPDGRSIAVQGFADGTFHIWTITTDGETRQLTRGYHDDLQPAFSPDGTQVAFASAREGSHDIWTVDIRTGALRRVTTAPAPETQPTWSPDGRAIAYVRDNTIEAVELASGAVRTVVPAAPGSVSAPSWSPDGNRIAFLRTREGAQRLMVSDRPGPIGASGDVSSFPPEWLSPDELLHGADGHIAVSTLAGATRTVPFTATFKLSRDQYPRKEYDFDSTAPKPVRGIAGPALSPDGRSVVFKALNDLWLMPIGGPPRRITRDGFYEVDPVFSRDGRSIAYASDKAGTEDLYVLDLASNTERRVTSLPGTEVAPAFAPGDRVLAFQDESAQTKTVDLATGAVTRVLPPLNAPGRPSWSADGKTLALAVLAAGHNRIQLTDVASGTSRIVEPAPQRSVSTRGDDGPVWSPDGKWLAFSLESTLWVLPVDAQGTPTGPGRRVTAHASDAPTWSGDSKSLLYLNNGRLRMVAVDGSWSREVPVDLNFTPDRPAERILIHAGRLWDGRHPEPRSDVDILVTGNRIERIEPHRPDRPPDGRRFIDASKLTVVPGLIDMHNHQEMRSKSYGDRQGRLLLSFGITTTRSTGDPVYRALEDREALEAGLRVGPRFFMTGEMLEGNRVSWEFSRPVFDEHQLALELSRARELGYDLVKTYERFRIDWQAGVTRQAHALGIPTTSHYLYPGIAHGVDMKEHLAGPTKWGFGFSRNSSRGNVYEDVIRLHARGGMPLSTTLFSSSALLADDPGIVDDPRVRALYPVQERDVLHAELLCAQGKGPCGFLFGNAEMARREVGVIKRILAAGGTVVAGTDSPLDNPAVSMHMNLRAMGKHGVAPFAALHSATLAAARQLGVDHELGSVEAGKLADLVVTGGDPTKDLAALGDVRLVMENGRPHRIDELLAPFPSHSR